LFCPDRYPAARARPWPLVEVTVPRALRMRPTAPTRSSRRETDRGLLPLQPIAPPPPPFITACCQSNLVFLSAPLSVHILLRVQPDGDPLAILFAVVNGVAICLAGAAFAAAVRSAAIVVATVVGCLRREKHLLFYPSACPFCRRREGCCLPCSACLESLNSILPTT